MGFRLFKKVKICKGVSVNISKSGASVSVGPKGAKVTVNTKGGITASAGIPGTGISYRETVNTKSNRRKTEYQSNNYSGVAIDSVPETQGFDGQNGDESEPTNTNEKGLPRKILEISLKVVGGLWFSFMFIQVIRCLFTPELNSEPISARMVLAALALLVGSVGAVPFIIFRKRNSK